jgi:tRNA A-37 threonylcarbamoyl transferase component Bud32
MKATVLGEILQFGYQLWFMVWNHSLASKYRTDIINLRKHSIEHGPTSAFKLSLNLTANCYKNGLFLPFHGMKGEKNIFAGYVDTWENMINENTKVDDFLWNYRCAIYDYQAHYIESITNATVREQLLMLSPGRRSTLRYRNPISQWNQSVLETLKDDQYNFRPNELALQLEKSKLLMNEKIRTFQSYMWITCALMIFAMVQLFFALIYLCEKSGYGALSDANRLGEGSQGVVYKVRYVTYDTYFPYKHYEFRAVKSYKKKDKYFNCELATFKELRRLSKPNPHLPKFFETYETKHKNYIVMEYVRGMTLGDIIENNIAEEDYRQILIGLLEWQYLCFRWFQQLISAIQALHSLNIMHRDINPFNILIKKDGTLVLLDLGTSKPFVRLSYNTRIYSHMLRPPEYYWVEQGLVDKYRYGLFYDVYCAGVVALICYHLKFYREVGRHPNTGEILGNNLEFARYECAELPDNVMLVLLEIFKDRTSAEEGASIDAIATMLGC